MDNKRAPISSRESPSTSQVIYHAVWWLIGSLHPAAVDSFFAFCSFGPSAGTRIVTMSAEASTSQQKSSVGQMLGGLVFLKTADRMSLVDFYRERIGMSPWLEQPNITILSHGNMVLGFHQITDLVDLPDLQGMYTFVYPSTEKVDEMYHRLLKIADGEPRCNDRYRIYQFFAKDPEGRNLEFQAFLHPLSEVSSRVTNCSFT